MTEWDELRWKLTANHEAGHALAATLLGFTVRAVRLNRDGSADEDHRGATDIAGDLMSTCRRALKVKSAASPSTADLPVPVQVALDGAPSPTRGGQLWSTAAGLVADPWTNGDRDMALVARLVGEDRVQDVLDETSALLRPYRARVLPSMARALLERGELSQDEFVALLPARSERF